MERRVLTRHEKYWTEIGRGDGQGDVEKEYHQSYYYQRHCMMGNGGEGKCELGKAHGENEGRQQTWMASGDWKEERKVTLEMA